MATPSTTQSRIKATLALSLAQAALLVSLLTPPAQAQSGTSGAEEGAVGEGVVISPLAASSDDYGVHEKHVERLTEAQKIAPVGADGFGERISYFSGGLSFNNADISLPGNNALPVELRRTFAVEDRRELTTGPSSKGHLGGFAEWDLDVPHLSGMFKASVGWQVAGSSPTQRCSTTAEPASYYTFASYDYWNGYNLNIPGQGSEPLLASPNSKVPSPGNGTTYPWITRSFWRISCKAATANGYAGQAFVATSPDGLKYHFDYVVTRVAPSVKYGGYPAGAPVYDVMTRETVFFLVTKIEDRFGNYVQYTYTGDKLASIRGYNASGVADGRQITIAWSGDKISTATASTGTWTYAYTGNVLTSVTRPDSSTWAYGRTGKLFIRMLEPLEPQDDYVADCPEISEPAGDTVVYTVKHPAGATATYTLAPLRMYRSNVPHHCIKPSTTYEYLQIPNYSDTFVLASKSVSGAGISPSLTWNYSYEGGNGLAFQSNCGTPGSLLCPSVRKVTITGASPINTWEQHEYGILYDINEGQLLGRKIGSSSSTILQTTTNTYMTSAEVASQPFPDLIGQNPLMYSDQLANRLRPLKTRVTNQQGTNFTRTTTDFDPFGQSESDSVSGTASRIESTEYYHDLPKWVIGQVARQLINGTEVSKIDFNANALPWKSYSYGLLTQTLAYDSFGVLASVTDGRSNAITLSNWKFGVPQSISFPGPQSIAATVDSRGWITQVTDEMGYSTNYGYDAMGRVSSITYPTGDSTPWTPVSISFLPATASVYGLPVGHWVQVTTQGAFRKEVHFDGLWRSVIQVESDTGIAGTARFKGWKYDYAGRVVFDGYPRSSATGVASFTTGTTNSYDALGRPASTSRSTELGNAVTQYSYLTGFKTRARNPRTFNTDTTFQAFGEPSTDAPLTITQAVGQPEQQLTTIVRNAFGATTKITRSGTYSGSVVSASRDYVYDSYQRLCKRVEPETGATIFEYDLASNIAWMAEGSSLTSLSCDRASVPTSERVARTYDGRNRLTLVNYPDTTGDVTTTYFADGAVQSVSTGGVTTTYGYNKRRLPTSEQLQHGSVNWLVQYNYGALGHLGSITYPNGHAVSLSPNALGQATQAGSYASNATYWPSGALKGFTYANGIVHTMTQNSRLLPSQSRDALGGAVAVDFGYDYDFNGNLAGITDAVAGVPAGDRDMTYDALDRLVGVTTGTVYGGQESFQYDPLDNIRVAIRGAREHRYSYNTKWQLEAIKNPAGVSLYGLLHDVRGNVTQRKAGDTFVFDRANRLLSSSLGGGSYLYDGLGRRVKKVVGGATHYYLYSRDGQVLYAQDGAAGLYETYVYLSGGLVAKSSAPISGGTTTVRYQHTDGLGSPVAESDTSAQVFALEKYTAYGDVVDGTISRGHGYTGHQSDPEIGLVYMQQRYYDSVLGRFLSTDSDSVDLLTGWNFNRYSYAANNPYRFTDPDGRTVACDGSTCQIRCIGIECLVDAQTYVTIRVISDLGDIVRVLSESGEEPPPGEESSESDGPEFVDIEGNRRPLTGEPGSTVRAGTGSRTYGEDGYPKTDRDTPHPDEKGSGSEDHVHDWDRPSDGSPPTSRNRGPSREPKAGDPPKPRGANVPPPKKD